MSKKKPKREFNPNDVAAQFRSLVLKIAVIAGGLVLVRELFRLLITPGKWIPWILNERFPELAAKIELPLGLHNIAILRAPVEWLKGIWLFLAIPLAGIFLVVFIYWLWNYVIVPLFHLLARIVTLLKRLFGGKVKRHIILCIDGTWNYPEHFEGGVLATSNVFKFWENLEGKRRKGLEWAAGASRIKEWRSADGKTRQIGLYYHGVGNPATYSALGGIVGGAFGFGAENLKEEAYRDIIRLYTSKDDKVTVVGFSRGAAIARLVAAYVGQQGVPHLTLSDTKIGKFLVGTARKMFKGWGWIQKRDVRVDFLGVWDTVGAFGIPKNVLGIPFQSINVLKDMNVSECVKKVVHLLALDEQRDSFVPTLVEPPKPRPDGTRADTDIHEVWFPGVHSNVGGGFANDGLACLSLEYMVGKFLEYYGSEAHVRATAFEPPDNEPSRTADAGERLRKNVKSRLRPSKGAMYNMQPREVPDGAVLHKSVRIRMEVMASLTDDEKEKLGCDSEYCPPNVLDLIERLGEKRKRLVGALIYFNRGPIPESLEQKLKKDCEVREVG